MQTQYPKVSITVDDPLFGDKTNSMSRVSSEVLRIRTDPIERRQIFGTRYQALMRPEGKFGSSVTNLTQVCCNKAIGGLTL